MLTAPSSTENTTVYTDISASGSTSVHAEPEDGAAVLHAQLAPEQVQEQVAVVEEIGVERHGGKV